MVVDGLLFFFVIWKLWKWQLWKAVALMLPFVIVDVTFFSANFLKLFEGAWAPLLFGASMVLLILTWRRGTGILASKTRRTEVPLDTLFRSLEKKPPHIVQGTAVFLTSDPEFAPTAMLHNLKHNKVLHENNVILTIVTADHAARAGRRPSADHAAVEAFLPRVAEVRLHGAAQRAEGAGDRAPARLAIRHHVDVVLPVAAHAAAVAAIGHAVLAGSPVHLAGALGQRRHGLLPDPDRAGGGSRHPGDRLAGPKMARMVVRCCY